MSIDVLQDKIRKKKNALIVDLSLIPSALPKMLPEIGENQAQAYARFCREILAELKPLVPAVRFGFAAFTMHGSEGIQALQSLLREASSLGYYVLLDGPELSSPAMAQFVAETVFGKNAAFPCDGLVLSLYAGSDMIKPFLPYCGEGKKDIFCIIRNANKSASELQDLLTGSRLVHLAAADRVSRYSGDLKGKFGYSRAAVLAAASSAESLRSLREKYPSLFILVDGLDYPSANMKNASYAFDKLGHGAIVSVGTMVTCAWQEKGPESHGYAADAREAVERIQKNLNRYVSIL